MSRRRVVHPRFTAAEIGQLLAAERPDLNPSEYLYLLLLHRVGRLLETLNDQYSRRTHGISGAELRVLFALLRAGPPYALRPTVLSRALLITSSAVTKQVDRLLSMGHVERRREPGGSGGILISLTGTGAEIANSALTELTGSSVFTHALLQEEERRLLADLAGRMLLDLEARVQSYTDLVE